MIRLLKTNDQVRHTALMALACVGACLVGLALRPSLSLHDAGVIALVLLPPTMLFSCVVVWLLASEDFAPSDRVNGGVSRVRRRPAHLRLVHSRDHDA